MIERLRAGTPRGSAWDGLIELVESGAVAVPADPGAAIEALATRFVPGRPSRAAFAAERRARFEAGGLSVAEAPSLAALGRWRLADDPDRARYAALCAVAPSDGIEERAAAEGWIRLRTDRAEVLDPERLPPAYRASGSEPLVFSWRGAVLPHRQLALTGGVRADAGDVADWLAARAPVIVGVTGPAAAGKSTLCEAIVARLPSAVAIGADRFLWPGPGLRWVPSAGGRTHRLRGPGIYDDLSLRDALAAWRRGDAPVLPPDPHGRRPGGEVPPADVILVEGVAVGFDAEVRAALDAVLGVWLDDVPRLERKWARDAGRDSTHDRAVVADFARKQHDEVKDAVEEVLRGADAIWSAGRLYPSATGPPPSSKPGA